MKEKILALLEKAKTSITTLFNRFPFATIYIIFQFVLFSLLIEWDYFDIHPKQEYFLSIGIAATYSLIFLSILIQILSERFKWDVTKKYLLNFLALFVTSILYVVFLRNDFLAFDSISGSFTAGTYRLVVYILLTGLSLLVIPFVKDKDNETWWNFTIFSINKFAVSLLYAIVIYAGVAIALGALQQFWEIELFTHQYELLPVFSFILFAPLYFLSEVYDFSSKAKYELPKFLNIFGKFILTPLIVIYSAILYPYMISFPFKQEWPSNQATFIILAMLTMIYAVMYIFWQSKEGTPERKFLNVFTKIANGIALPTILFWGYSLWLRIDAYNLTVNRFMLMVIIFWFLFNSAYLLFSKVKDVRVIIGTFIGLVAFFFYFPFTSFYFGQRAQISRLIEIAKSQETYVNNLVVVGQKEKTSGKEVEMIDTLSYLNQFHSLNQASKYLSSDVKTKLNIDKYGYAKTYLYRFGTEEPIFFKERLPLSGNGLEEIKYRTLVLSNSNIPVPQGYSTFETVEMYTSDEIKLGKNFAEYKGIRFDIVLDITNPLFEVGSYQYSVFSKPMPSESFGPDTLKTTDASLLSFKSGDYVLIAKTMGVDVKNNEITNIQYINGILFKK